MSASASAPPPTIVSNKQTQKLERDLKTLIDRPLPFLKDLKLSSVDGHNQLAGVLLGPENSDYDRGEFRFLVQFPPEYPFKPPDFLFTTAICHPNVDSKTGIACHDQLIATWKGNITLNILLNEMHQLLAKPNYDTPIVGDALTGKTREKARQWTREFAQPS
jgi:ubiquitin-protein ligase